MSELSPNPVEDAITHGNDFLEHYGVKGMKWGQRKNHRGPVQASPTVTRRGKAKVQTSGGQAKKPTGDAIKAAKAQQILKKSGPAALTNRQLKELQTRMNLEKSVKELTSHNDPVIKKFIKKKLGMGFEQSVNQEIQRQLQKARK